MFADPDLGSRSASWSESFGTRYERTADSVQGHDLYAGKHNGFLDSCRSTSSREPVVGMHVAVVSLNVVPYHVSTYPGPTTPACQLHYDKSPGVFGSIQPDALCKVRQNPGRSHALLSRPCGCGAICPVHTWTPAFCCYCATEVRKRGMGACLNLPACQ